MLCVLCVRVGGSLPASDLRPDFDLKGATRNHFKESFGLRVILVLPCVPDLVGCDDNPKDRRTDSSQHNK